MARRRLQTSFHSSQLTRRLCLSLESKGVVTRELIEGDRLASCEPLHVIRQQARFPLAVETLQVDQSIGGPFRHATGQEGFLEFGRRQVHIVDLASRNSRDFLRNLPVGKSFTSGQCVGFSFVSGRGENYYCHSSNIADIKYADRAGPLAPVERVLRSNRGRV